MTVAANISVQNVTFYSTAGFSTIQGKKNVRSAKQNYMEQGYNKNLEQLPPMGIENCLGGCVDTTYLMLLTQNSKYKIKLMERWW